MNNESMVSYDMAKEFGVQAAPGACYYGFAPGGKYVPIIQPDYHFDVPRLRDMFMFWQSGLKALKILGDPAAGKTSLVEQFHARMRAPLLIVSCSRLEKHELMGQMLPDTSGNLRWVDGPVLTAARHGYSLLLDEYNTLEPSTSNALNAILEGYTLTIPETGEELRPHPGFRVYATENPVASKLAVAGRNVQDVANDDRWMGMEVDYLPAVAEEKIVANAMINLKCDADAAAQSASVMVQTARKVRDACRMGKTAEGRDTAIDRPMSTRVLKRWGMLTQLYAGVAMREGKSPIIYTLPKAFITSSPEMAAEVEALAKTTAGIDDPA